MTYLETNLIKKSLGRNSKRIGSRIEKLRDLENAMPRSPIHLIESPDDRGAAILFLKKVIFKIIFR